jgi:AAA ATPase domain
VAPPLTHLRRCRRESSMQSLFGREREIGVLAELIDGVHDHGAALPLHGEAGAGKSALLDAASDRAKAQGILVLTAIGVQAETQLPFAGLHQLLRPILNEVNALPTPQRNALQAAFGMTNAPAPERAPVLVIVEDAQWLDGSTADALAFVARRVESDPLVLLIAIRDEVESALAEAGPQDLRVEHLDDAAAGALLDAHTPDLAPTVRERLLEDAAGNPLALIELPTALKAGQLGGAAPLARRAVPGHPRRAISSRHRNCRSPRWPPRGSPTARSGSACISRIAPSDPISIACFRSWGSRRARSCTRRSPVSACRHRRLKKRAAFPVHCFRSLFSSTATHWESCSHLTEAKPPPSPVHFPQVQVVVVGPLAAPIGRVRGEGVSCGAHPCRYREL